MLLKNKDGASKIEASGSGSSNGNAATSRDILERYICQQKSSIADVEANIEQIERRCRELSGECSRCDHNMNYRG